MKKVYIEYGKNSVQKPSQAVYNYVTIIPTLIYYKISSFVQFFNYVRKIHLIELKTYFIFNI